MVTNNEKMAYYFLPLLLAFLLGLAGGCGLTLFLGENLPDNGNGAFQAGIGLGQSLNGELETERTVREAEVTAEKLGNSVGREEESLRDGKEILRRIRERGAEKTGEP
jgi:hypothetical protein